MAEPFPEVNLQALLDQLVRYKLQIQIQQEQKEANK